jgi:hypothetical protein
MAANSILPGLPRYGVTQHTALGPRRWDGTRHSQHRPTLHKLLLHNAARFHPSVIGSSTSQPVPTTMLGTQTQHNHTNQHHHRPPQWTQSGGWLPAYRLRKRQRKRLRNRLRTRGVTSNQLGGAHLPYAESDLCCRALDAAVAVWTRCGHSCWPMYHGVNNHKCAAHTAAAVHPAPAAATCSSNVSSSPGINRRRCTAAWCHKHGTGHVGV